MSLHPRTIPAIPSETIRVAHAAFPHGNSYLQLKDELGSIYQDEAFTHLFPKRGQPAAAPWQLAMVTVMQYMVGIPLQTLPRFRRNAYHDSAAKLTTLF